MLCFLSLNRIIYLYFCICVNYAKVDTFCQLCHLKMYSASQLILFFFLQSLGFYPPFYKLSPDIHIILKYCLNNVG